MSFFNTSLSLQEIEKELEEQLKNPKNQIRIIGDLDISYEDYYYLLLRVRGLEQHHGHLEFIERYRLSILTLWIFGLRLEKKKYYGYKRFGHGIGNVKQYYIRKYVEMMLNTFAEYGLNTYSIIGNGTFEELLSLLVVHIGIPEDLQDDFCHLLDDSLAYREFSTVADRFLMRLPEYMKGLYRFVGKDTIIEMISYSRKMFADYRFGGITRREAYRKYPKMSSNLMKGCFQWCEVQEVYAKSFG